MRKFLIAGNWKMNCTPSEAALLLEGIKEKKGEVSEEVDVLVCPPFVSLSMAVNYLHETDIQVGAQNMHFESSGAYTGEISASMIAESGCNYVILGHSERREYFNEDDELINKKIGQAISNDLAPILCVGESLEQRKAGEQKMVVGKQIRAALEGINTDQVLNVVIAYEPIWAIGTGETATPEQAQQMHKFIRDLVSEIYDSDVATSLRILYGGSMKPANADELLSQPDVDGGLIGGASLDADSFTEIITIAEKLS
ncbi:triose-phosphate isomerase [Balneola sp. MJW-20]|uniref:triose-phosphate isomerase n=1 Tax=Gracilimonas aurantiaca TaxID=3234185 RepID=UPI0034662AF9